MTNQTITPDPVVLTVKGHSPKVIARGGFNLATVMDAIAAKLVADGVVKTAYGYPVPLPTVPCAFVGYPTKIDYNVTMGGGGNGVHVLLPIFFAVGKVIDKTSRDQLSLVIDVQGASAIKASMDGTLGGSVASCVCDGAEITIEKIGEVDYLAAKFELDFYA